MAIHKLSVRKVATSNPGKYEDGYGLRLVVSNSGSKKWVLRYTLHGRRREMGLGSYPSVGLADARNSALKCRRMVAKGVDPIETRRMVAKRIPAFTACAARYIRGHRHGWHNAKHARQWVSTLKTYARPVIGKKPVNAITTEDILQILSPIWGYQDRDGQTGAGAYREHHGFRGGASIPRPPQSGSVAGSSGQAASQALAGEGSHSPPGHAVCRGARVL